LNAGKKVVVHRGGTIKKGRLIDVTRCRVAGSDVSVARAANLHQATVSGLCPCKVNKVSQWEHAPWQRVAASTFEWYSFSLLMAILQAAT